ncbi:MAG: hypothetical protein FWE16_00405 [Firmicutes bacterium]|nr:hypothetical protein [Bacillota bacterium]
MTKFERYNETHHGEVNSIFRKDRRDLFGSGLFFLIVAVALFGASIFMFSLNDFNFTAWENLYTGAGYLLIFAFFFPGIPAFILFPKGVAFGRALNMFGCLETVKHI